LLQADGGIPKALASKCATSFLEKGVSLGEADKNLILQAFWTEFFKEANIPDEFANKYAMIFVKQCIRFVHIDFVHEAILHTLGIDVIGYCYDIKMTAKKVTFN
jgi:hypothetical protein